MEENFKGADDPTTRHYVLRSTLDGPALDAIRGTPTNTPGSYQSPQTVGMRPAKPKRFAPIAWSLSPVGTISSAQPSAIATLLRGAVKTVALLVLAANQCNTALPMPELSALAMAHLAHCQEAKV